MLNEIYEYKTYTERCASSKEYFEKYGCRLAHKNITDLNGLRRPLLMISRREISGIEENISDDGNYLARENMSEKLVKAKNAMCIWCGFDVKAGSEDVEQGSTQERSNSFTLPDYIEEILSFNDIDEETEINNLKKESRKDAIISLSKKEESFNRDSFRVESGEASNDKNRIIFQEILADALNIDQPLTAYYLVADCAKAAQEMFPNDENANEKYIFNHVKGHLYGKNASRDALDEKFSLDVTRGKYVFQDRHEILSILAIFMLNKRMLSETSKNVQNDYSTPIKKVDLLHWIRYTSDSGTYHLNSFVIEENGREEPLFKFDRIISSLSGGMLKIKPEWYVRCGWKLVTKEELSNLLKEPGNENILFYRDYYFNERCYSITKGNKKKGIPDKKIYHKPQLKKNSFYQEHKTFWKEASKENDLIATLFRNSFGEK